MTDRDAGARRSWPTPNVRKCVENIATTAYRRGGSSLGERGLVLTNCRTVCVSVMALTYGVCLRVWAMRGAGGRQWRVGNVGAGSAVTP
jgi:hypothetical protein